MYKRAFPEEWGRENSNDIKRYRKQEKPDYSLSSPAQPHKPRHPYASCPPNPSHQTPYASDSAGRAPTSQEATDSLPKKELSLKYKVDWGYPHILPRPIANAPSKSRNIDNGNLTKPLQYSSTCIPTPNPAPDNISLQPFSKSRQTVLSKDGDSKYPCKHQASSENIMNRAIPPRSTPYRTSSSVLPCDSPVSSSAKRTTMPIDQAQSPNQSTFKIGITTYDKPLTTRYRNSHVAPIDKNRISSSSSLTDLQQAKRCYERLSRKATQTNQELEEARKVVQRHEDAERIKELEEELNRIKDKLSVVEKNQYQGEIIETRRTYTEAVETIRKSYDQAIEVKKKQLKEKDEVIDEMKTKIKMWRGKISYIAKKQIFEKPSAYKSITYESRITTFDPLTDKSVTPPPRHPYMIRSPMQRQDPNRKIPSSLLAKAMLSAYNHRSGQAILKNCLKSSPLDDKHMTASSEAVEPRASRRPEAYTYHTPEGQRVSKVSQLGISDNVLNYHSSEKRTILTNYTLTHLQGRNQGQEQEQQHDEKQDEEYQRMLFYDSLLGEDEWDGFGIENDDCFQERDHGFGVMDDDGFGVMDDDGFGVMDSDGLGVEDDDCLQDVDFEGFEVEEDDCFQENDDGYGCEEDDGFLIKADDGVHVGWSFHKEEDPQLVM
ncbi:uncharacterized protein L201_002176 [Kwoniella dendrophila CBS 6074]|uniref:Uncharacterized protein n=1 Tax=Kwoniella dendrophila CBS 6074 TaxID=1295534 RepID=A0AAX4JQY2_9TREE